jgi:hypothetical protein
MERSMSFRRRAFLDRARVHSAAGNVSTFAHHVFRYQYPDFPSHFIFLSNENVAMYAESSEYYSDNLAELVGS